MIIAEAALNMGVFPASGAWPPGRSYLPGHPVRSQERSHANRQGQPGLRGVLSEADAAADRARAFHGEHYEVHREDALDKARQDVPRLRRIGELIYSRTER